MACPLNITRGMSLPKRLAGFDPIGFWYPWNYQFCADTVDGTHSDRISFILLQGVLQLHRPFLNGTGGSLQRKVALHYDRCGRIWLGGRCGTSFRAASSATKAEVLAGDQNTEPI